MPESVAERTKIELKDGSGLAEHLYRLGERKCSYEKMRDMQKEKPSFNISNQASAWFLEIWLECFGESIGTDCAEMRERGIIRQDVNDYIRKSNSLISIHS